MPANSPTSQLIDVRGRKTQLTSGGSGPPLVYLHSAGGETEWTGFHAALAEKFTLHVPAHPGFALSEGLDEIDDIYDLAWHYVDLFEQQGWRNVPVVGFSLGAWIALELAILRPELVRRMVLADAVGLYVPGAPIAEFFIDDIEAMKRLLFFDPTSSVVAEAMPTALDDPRMLLWLRSREATARVAWNPYFHNPKLPAHLRRITCPTLVLWGRDDHLIPLAHGEYYAQHLPSAKLKVYDRCGHMLPFERREDFARDVAAFVNS